MTDLRKAANGAEDPSAADASVGCGGGEAVERVAHGHKAVDADQHQHEGAQVQRKHLQKLEKLAADVAGVPLHGVAPDAFARQTEESDEQVGDGQVQNESVDWADAVLAVPVDADDCGDVCQQRRGR